jgi:hypothetical protein
MFFLYVRVVEAKDLPPNPITGAPVDPYVEVKLGNTRAPPSNNHEQFTDFTHGTDSTPACWQEVQLPYVKQYKLIFVTE